MVDAVFFFLFVFIGFLQWFLGFVYFLHIYRKVSNCEHHTSYTIQRYVNMISTLEHNWHVTKTVSCTFFLGHLIFFSAWAVRHCTGNYRVSLNFFIKNNLSISNDYFKARQMQCRIRVSRHKYSVNVLKHNTFQMNHIKVGQRNMPCALSIWVCVCVCSNWFSSSSIFLSFLHFICLVFGLPSKCRAPFTPSAFAHQCLLAEYIFFHSL